MKRLMAVSAEPTGPRPSRTRRDAEVVLGRIRDVVRRLEDDPGLTALELADAMGLSRRDMSLLLLRLEEHGHVAHEGRRWFPAAG